MRNFSYITFGKILKELRDEGLNITRSTLRKKESEGLFASSRTVGKWRVFTRDEADIIKKLLKEEFKIETPQS